LGIVGAQARRSSIKAVKDVIIRDVKFVFFVKFELRLQKFELNSNFVYVLE